MDRKTLALALDEWMTTGYNHLLEAGQHKPGQHLLKSYLLEANVAGAIQEPSALEEFFASNGATISVEVAASDDPTIYSLWVGKSRTQFHLDTLDPRFWVMHSIAPAEDTDKAIRSLILRTRNLDSFWLPTHQMEKWIGELGVPHVLTSKFAVPTGIYQESIPETQFLDDSLLFRIGSSGDARKRLESYRESPYLASQLALWSASVTRRWSDGDQTTTSNVASSGKITARGNSFRLHDEVVSGVRTRYATLIEDWENRFRIEWQNDNGKIVPSGETAVIAFPEQFSESDLRNTIGILFSCTEPFRMSGVPVENGKNRYVVKAIDLHTGHKVNFEINRSFIRAYLQPTTCGNVLARMLTNLQHFVDARLALQ